MRCSTFVARNAGSAAWCTQCFASLRSATPPDAPPAEAPPAPPPAPPTPAEAEARDIRVRGGDVEWRCAACGAWSPLEDPVCTVCVAPRHGFGGEGAPATSPTASAGQTTAVVASVLLPGLGHVLRGSVGTGLARMVLWLRGGGGGIAVLLGSGGGLAAAVLLLAALLVWAVTLVDLQRLAAGRPPLATGRVLAWSVVGVTVVLALVALAAVAGAGSPTAVTQLVGVGPAAGSLSR